MAHTNNTQAHSSPSLSLLLDPMTKCSFLITISILVVITVVGANTCGDYKDCSSCTAEAGCMWALLYNCAERCMNINYKDPKRLVHRNVIWRSTVSNSTECASKEECRIIEGNINDPSFEGPRRTTWWYRDNLALREVTEEGQDREFYDVPLDGNKFLMMGGYPNNVYGRGYGVLLEKFKIGKDATHLSFFYGFPFYSRALGNYYSRYFNNRTSLSVFIDKELILHMSNKTIDADYYNRETKRFYFPMNIDIKKFADNKNHDLELHFVEGKNEGNDTIAQAMCVDYLQIISSNSKRKYLVFLLFSFFIFLFSSSGNGSTTDGLLVENLNYSEWMCSEYCLEKYYGDSVCDLACVHSGCYDDGDDCDCKRPSPLLTFSCFC